MNIETHIANPFMNEPTSWILMVIVGSLHKLLKNKKGAGISAFMIPDKLFTILCFQ